MEKNVENPAEFRMIYVFGARRQDDGLFEGEAVCMDDNDDLTELLKDIQKKEDRKKQWEEENAQKELDKELMKKQMDQKKK